MAPLRPPRSALEGNAPHLKPVGLGHKRVTHYPSVPRTGNGPNRRSWANQDKLVTPAMHPARAYPEL